MTSKKYSLMIVPVQNWRFYLRAILSEVAVSFGNLWSIKLWNAIGLNDVALWAQLIDKAYILKNKFWEIHWQVKKHLNSDTYSTHGMWNIMTVGEKELDEYWIMNILLMVFMEEIIPIENEKFDQLASWWCVLAFGWWRLGQNF